VGNERAHRRDRLAKTVSNTSNLYTSGCCLDTIQIQSTRSLHPDTDSNCIYHHFSHRNAFVQVRLAAAIQRDARRALREDKAPAHTTAAYVIVQVDPPGLHAELIHNAASETKKSNEDTT